MATRKTGSRQIVVDGVAYRWRIRRRATYPQTDYGTGILHVAVELVREPGSLLVLYTDRPHPADCIERPLAPVLPSDVAIWIRGAIHAGWKPAAGTQFFARTIGEAVERAA